MISRKIRELLLRKKTVIIILAVFFLFFIFYYSIIRSEAETVYFYPSVCLGNWQNPANAQDKPESMGGAASLNVDNSAVFSSSPASSREILCGGFINESSERIDVKKVSLKLFWSQASEGQTASVAAAVNETASSTTDAPILEEAEPSAATEDSAEPAAVATFLDDGGAENIAASSSVSEAQPESGQESETEAAPDLFVLRYTFDGDNWTMLANLKSLEQAADIELPINSLQDLSNIRFSLESVSQQADVYLDGMALAVDYGAFNQENEDGDVPDFKNSELVSIRSNNDYSLVLLQGLDQKYSLWLYNREEGDFWKKIDTSDGIKNSGPLALKNNYAFWVSGDGQSLIGYSISANNYFSQSIDLDDNIGLNFDIDNFTIRYSGNQLLLQDQFSGEEKALDDSDSINREVSADFQREENLEPEEQTPEDNILDVNFSNQNITITALDASSTATDILDTADNNADNSEEVINPDVNAALPESRAENQGENQEEAPIYSLPVIDTISSLEESAPSAANTIDVVAD